MKHMIEMRKLLIRGNGVLQYRYRHPISGRISNWIDVKSVDWDGKFDQHESEENAPYPRKGQIGNE